MTEQEKKLRSDVPKGVIDRVPENVTLDDIWILLQTHIYEEELFRKNLEKAFPTNRHGEPDYAGHGDFHIRVIERAAKSEVARERLMERVIGGSVWGAIVLTGTAVLAYLKDYMTKG